MHYEYERGDRNAGPPTKNLSSSPLHVRREGWTSRRHRINNCKSAFLRFRDPLNRATDSMLLVEAASVPAAVCRAHQHRTVEEEPGAGFAKHEDNRRHQTKHTSATFYTASMHHFATHLRTQYRRRCPRSWRWKHSTRHPASRRTCRGRCSRSTTRTCRGTPRCK